MKSISFYKDVIEKRASDDTLELTPLNKRIQKIKGCGNSAKLLEISYLDKSKNKTKRLVEPYKLTESDFWGYDILKNQIRRFKVSNIKGIKTTTKSFDPKWDIEM